MIHATTNMNNSSFNIIITVTNLHKIYWIEITVCQITQSFENTRVALLIKIDSTKILFTWFCNSLQITWALYARDKITISKDNALIWQYLKKPSRFYYQSRMKNLEDRYYTYLFLVFLAKYASWLV